MERHWRKVRREHAATARAQTPGRAVPVGRDSDAHGFVRPEAGSADDERLTVHDPECGRTLVGGRRSPGSDGRDYGKERGGGKHSHAAQYAWPRVDGLPSRDRLGR